MGAEGIALHKRGICKAKHAKHKLLTTKACNNKNYYGSRRESTKTVRGAEGRTLHKLQIARQSTNNTATR